MTVPEVTSDANAANPANELAPLAALATPPAPNERDGKGQFLTGNNGGGRPKGSRNKLSEAFLTALASDFQKHGSDAIEAVRRTDPKAYLQIIAAVTAKLPLVEANIQNNTLVNRVMIVKGHCSDEEWEARLRSQQQRLMESAAKPKESEPF